MDYIAMIPMNFSFPMIYITHDQKEVDRLAEGSLYSKADASAAQLEAGFAVDFYRNRHIN